MEGEGSGNEGRKEKGRERGGDVLSRHDSGGSKEDGKRGMRERGEGRKGKGEGGGRHHAQLSHFKVFDVFELTFRHSISAGEGRERGGCY